MPFSSTISPHRQLGPELVIVLPAVACTVIRKEFRVWNTRFRDFRYLKGLQSMPPRHWATAVALVWRQMLCLCSILVVIFWYQLPLLVCFLVFSYYVYLKHEVHLWKQTQLTRGLTGTGHTNPSVAFLKKFLNEGVCWSISAYFLRHSEHFPFDSFALFNIEIVFHL